MSPSTVSASHFPETKSSRMPASSISSVSGATEPVSMNEGRRRTPAWRPQVRRSPRGGSSGAGLSSRIDRTPRPRPSRRFRIRTLQPDRQRPCGDVPPPTRRFLTPCYRHRRRCRRRYCCFRHCPRFHHSRHSLSPPPLPPSGSPVPIHPASPASPASPAPFISRRRPYRA